MDKYEVLEKYFKYEGFRDVQEETIDLLLKNERVLCLMPTGGGKSLIYQVAGICIKKTTIVISPLIALMNQQHNQMLKLGFTSVNFSGMDYRKQFTTITNMLQGNLPQFIFVSPERISTDGYLEFALNRLKDKIGLVAIDEVHCVSQWGEGFRPAYRNIEVFINAIFGENGWPSLLCLTATLNEKQQEQIKKEFKITTIVKGKNLWRDNLKLKIINIGSGKDETKDEELEKILDKHKGEKILVFVHRKFGNKGTTRTLYEKYKNVYEGVAFYDSDAPEELKEQVMNGFTEGTIKIVFATSAFGMGVDIADIRVVVNYLISETVEQYYQEVGRGGRDGKPAYGYLLYSNQSKHGRLKLLNSSLCTKKQIIDMYNDCKLKVNENFKSASYDSMNEEQRISFSLLIDYGVINIISKGLISVKCLKGNTLKGKQFIEDLLSYSKTGLTKIIATKAGKNISSLSSEIWNLCASRDIVFSKAPSRTLFYKTRDELPEELVEKIVKDQESKKKLRLEAFQFFVDGIEAGKTTEEIIREALDI